MLQRMDNLGEFIETAMEKGMKKGMEKLVEQQSINNQELIAKQANIIDHVTKPKTVLRDKNGKIIGVK